MYQALYRKYRPKNFNEIFGQDVIVKTLKNIIINNNLTHAFLFTGPRGTGKTSVAKILAKTINCENIVDGISCERCVSCTQINNKQTVDIIEIDAASNNGVDEIRELKSKVNLVPSNSKYKVYIIDEVHMLTTGAFNALLKTLEEPPSHIIFILATTEPHKIPATILSRCQRFDFKRISDFALISRLKDVCINEKIEINDDALLEIARISDGGMRDALSILDQVFSYSDNKITVEDVHIINGTLTKDELKIFFKSIFTKNLFEVLKQIDNFNESGKNFAKILEEMIEFLKNFIIFKQAPDYLSSKENNIEPYKQLNELIDESDILNQIDILNKNLVEIKKTNMPKLIFELTILKLMTKSEKLDSPTEKTSRTINIKQEINQDLKDDQNKQNNISLDKQKEISMVDYKLKEKIKELKEIRINNTLATFDKKELIKIKELQENLKYLLIDPDYSQIISIIFDGELKAAGNQSLIYVFDNQINSDIFNQNLLKIEEILEREFGIKYHVISTDIISWEIIKKEFNSKTKKYKYIEENIKISDIFKNISEQNEIENLFQNEIEYN